MPDQHVLLAQSRDSRERVRACMRLIAKMPTLAAIAYKTSIGAAPPAPPHDDNALPCSHAAWLIRARTVS